MTLPEITQSVTERGITQYSVITTGHPAVASRKFRKREDAEAIATLAGMCQTGYVIEYKTARRNVMCATEGWFITGPHGYKSITASVPADLIPHLQNGIATEDARAARAAQRQAEEVERELISGAEQVRREMGLATAAQVRYIMRLIAARTRSGDANGFFCGPTTSEGVRALTVQEASRYIESLNGNY